VVEKGEPYACMRKIWHERTSAIYLYEKNYPLSLANQNSIEIASHTNQKLLSQIKKIINATEYEGKMNPYSWQEQQNIFHLL
jgi:hypothetical protein